MENVIARLLQDFENGRVSRRQVIRSLGMWAAALSAGRTVSSAAQASGFKAIGVDHISYQVSDYRRTRDFYTDLMGMTVASDNNSNRCSLDFGSVRLIALNHPDSNPKPTIDHVAYMIDDWNTDKVMAELERRGLKPILEPLDRNRASANVKDPEGFDVQIVGNVKPGDKLYKKL